MTLRIELEAALVRRAHWQAREAVRAALAARYGEALLHLEKNRALGAALLQVSGRGPGPAARRLADNAARLLESPRLARRLLLGWPAAGPDGAAAAAEGKRGERNRFAAAQTLAVAAVYRSAATLALALARSERRAA